MYNIESFDERTVLLADNTGAYTLKLSIANLKNGKKVAYAKRSISYNKELYKKIKKTPQMGKSLHKASENSITTDSNKSSRYFIKVEDSEGRKLNEAQQEYFADNDKVFTDNGALKTYYHGSDNIGFTTVDTNKSDDGISFFLTDNKEVADSYAKDKDNLFSPDKPITFDELAEAIESYSFGDYEAEEVDGKYVVSELDGDSVTFDSVKEVQVYKQNTESINIVLSAYGKESFENYINKAIRVNRVLYANKTKSQQSYEAARV